MLEGSYVAIAGFDVGDLGRDLLEHPRSVVPEDARPRR